jgi:tagatose-6-phosphate ketose/aldose isomerase
MLEQFSGHPNVFCVVLDDVTNDQGLAMTSSFTNMVIVGQCLAHFEDLSRYREILQNIIQAGNEFLEIAVDASAQLAAEAYRRICFLGTGPLNAVAQESALKVLELTAGKIHTMAESYLGVRHGPLSALDEETLVVGFLSGRGTARAYEIDLLEETHSKCLGKKRVVISLNRDGRLKELADLVISIGDAEVLLDEYRPVIDVMFGQLLGLFSSLQFGLKPDSPSPNGVISRVVGKVKIHR